MDKQKRTLNRLAWEVAVALGLIMPVLGTNIGAGTPVAQAQASRTFPETGKSVRGDFLSYWDQNGGLAQQGFPISDEMQERSDTDGKTYTVQYFERAVFEAHPENPPQFRVLLQLLGTFYLKQKYPNGVQGETPNATDPLLFPQTGKRLGGEFRKYWESHGGLAQQGYPITEEFKERSAVDGKEYTVQYFERAVFEMHPEQTPEFRVLLSLLGTFRLQAKNAPPTQVPPTATPPRPAPTNTAVGPAPTNTPVVSDQCRDIPPSENASATPVCARRGTTFRIQAQGFQPGEMVAGYTTFPDGSVDDFGYQVQANSQGRISYGYETDPREPLTGIWVETLEGTSSGSKAFARFKVLP